jgi:uncharacterized protein YegL
MVDIVFLLDESRSMYRHKNYYIGLINSILLKQKNINPNTNFSLIKFSSTINTLCIDSKFGTLPEFTSEHYNPDGLTSLYDAIGHMIRIKYVDEKKEVLVIILTDGADNNSTEYDIISIVEEIEHVKNIGWTFMYIACNQDAQFIGKKLGIETCVTYNESMTSISSVADVCNLAIGKEIYRWYGVYSEDCDKDIPIDVTDLIEDICNFTI